MTARPMNMERPPAWWFSVDGTPRVRCDECAYWISVYDRSGASASDGYCSLDGPLGLDRGHVAYGTCLDAERGYPGRSGYTEADTWEDPCMGLE